MYGSHQPMGTRAIACPSGGDGTLWLADPEERGPQQVERVRVRPLDRDRLGQLHDGVLCATLFERDRTEAEVGRFELWIGVGHLTALGGRDDLAEVGLRGVELIQGDLDGAPSEKGSSGIGFGGQDLVVLRDRVGKSAVLGVLPGQGEARREQVRVLGHCLLGDQDVALDEAGAGGVVLVEEV